MEIIPIVIATVLIALLAVLLRKYLPEQALLLVTAAGVILLLWIITTSAPIFESAKALLDDCGMPGEYVNVLFKSLGICLITQLASDTCRDAGEQAMAGKAELAGRVALLMVGMPLFQKVAETVISLINQG